MLHIVLWKWKQAGYREAYTSKHVNVMAAMIRRNLTIPHRIICVTDDGYGISTRVEVHPLWNDFYDMQSVMGTGMPSCYRRLKLFDPDTQRDMGIRNGDRVCWIDLDAVVVANLDKMLSRPDTFLGWSVRGTYHLRVFNGSMTMFTAGELAFIWSEFDPETSPEKAKNAGYLGSDQGWLSYRLAMNPEYAGWTWPVIASYPRELMRRPLLPKGVAIAFFHGKRKPWHPEVNSATPWVAQHWKE